MMGATQSLMKAPLDVRFCMMINLNSSNDQCCKISVNNVNIVIQQQIHCKLENTYPAASWVEKCMPSVI